MAALHRAGWALVLALAAGSSAAAAELKLSFSGLSGGGGVTVAVFPDASSWGKRRAPAWSGQVPVREAEAGTTIALPPGRYGVMAYHDRNGNGRLDTLPIGMPVEPYGFSNNSRGTFGPPAWTAAAFDLPEGGAAQDIRLR